MSRNPFLKSHIWLYPPYRDVNLSRRLRFSFKIRDFTVFHCIISCRESMCTNRSKIINSSPIFFILEADTVSLRKKRIFIDLSQFCQYDILNIQNLNGHIVEIIIKYIEFQFVQAVILCWSYRLLPEFSVHWIYWEFSITCFDRGVCRLLTYICTFFEKIDWIYIDIDHFQTSKCL